MKLSKKDQFLLTVIAAIVGVGGFYWFYVKPARADLGTQQTKLTAAETANADLADTLSRLERDMKTLSGQSGERLRYSKAVPDSAQVPAAIYQIQRIADRADVEFSSISTQAVTELGGFAGRSFQIKVAGRFFDVDDFLYRLHRQVNVDARGRADISGRLFAVTKVDMALKGQGGQAGVTGAELKASDDVTATVDIVAFSTAAAGAAPASAATGATPFVSPNVGQASAVATGGTP
jgi:Type II secretion system (T2SS), protein M